LGLTVGCIFTTSVALSLAWAAHSVTLGTLSVGEFALVNAYMLRLAAPLEMLGTAITDMSEGAAYMKRLLDLLDTDVEPGSGTHDVAPRCKGSLEFRGVSFGYRKDRTVLNDISFTVPAGSTIAIVGPTGAGKSSLAKLLLRLYEPTSGRILLDGIDIAALSPHELRAAVSIVPQDTVLLNDTIAKNIALGTPSTPHDIEAAAQIAGMDSTIRNWPDEYATVVGERGLKLSGGERQRIAIARAILRNPHVLVFDEATSSLDAHTERAVLRNLRQRIHHPTTLVIAHRLSAVVDATTILVLADGALVEQGSHAALLVQNGWYASLWRAQRSTPVPA
jgi:ATP-binding cassette subfamily B protein